MPSFIFQEVGFEPIILKILFCVCVCVRVSVREKEREMSGKILYGYLSTATFCSSVSYIVHILIGVKY
jgi:hypothetical protein